MSSEIGKAQLEIACDIQIGDWIRESLAPWILFSEDPVTIGIVVPKGFESYVLIRHTRTGDNHGSLGNESFGNLEIILAGFTTTPEECFHALWEGHGWMHPESIGVFKAIKHPKLYYHFLLISKKFRKRRFKDRDRTQMQSLDHLGSNTLPQGIMESERFKLPNRNYLLMRGPLTEAKKIGYSFSDHFTSQFPNLLWPSDRSWIVAKEIDFNVTLVGGSEKLIQSILNSDSFTAQRFKVTDPIDQ